MLPALRAVGAVLGFYAITAGPLILVVSLTPPSWMEGIGAIAVQSAGLLLGVGLAGGVFLRNGWATWEMLGVRCPRYTVRGFGLGLGVGVVMAFLAVGLAVVVGGSRVSIAGEPAIEYVVAMLMVGALLLAAALAEEMLFRGYPLTRLSKVVGPVKASVALAMLFMLGHAQNPEVSLFGLLNIGLAALVLSAAFFTRGGLAAAWGLHVGWNGGLALGVDAPVSGWHFDIPMVDFFAGRSAWLTGGSFGPEGGLVSTVAMSVVLVWLIRIKNTSERI